MNKIITIDKKFTICYDNKKVKNFVELIKNHCAK